MSKIPPSPIDQIESRARFLGGRTFSRSRGNRTFFVGIFWNSTNFAYVSQFG